MERVHYKGLTQEHWNSFTFFEQMANVGSEVERALRWKEKDNRKYSSMAFERGLELLDLTISDAKNRLRLREIMRLRETLVDYFVFENEYNSTEKSWRSYFYAFNFAARIKT